MESKETRRPLTSMYAAMAEYEQLMQAERERYKAFMRQRFPGIEFTDVVCESALKESEEPTS